jgi:hypothetical protein
MDYNIKLYFVCSGTTCNDVIRSLINIKDKELMEYIRTYRNVKLKTQKFSHLDELGIREMNICSQNSLLIEKWDTDHLYPKVFCSLESSVIESAITLMDSSFDVCPIPFLSTKTNIQDEETYRYLLSFFPQDKKISSKYWTPFYLSFEIESQAATDFRYSKKKVEWKKPIFETNHITTPLQIEKVTSNSYSSYHSLSKLDISEFNRFMNFLIGEMIAEEVPTRPNSKPYSHPELKSVLFVCTPEWIQSFLKSHGQEYKEYTFENSSVWEFNMTVHCKVSAPLLSTFSKNKIYNIASTKLQMNQYQKIYPTPFNHEPLKWNTKNRYYVPMYKGENGYTMFQLRTPSEDISLKDLRNLKMSMCIETTNSNRIRNRVGQLEKSKKEKNKSFSETSKTKNHTKNKKNTSSKNKPKSGIIEKILNSYKIL